MSQPRTAHEIANDRAEIIEDADTLEEAGLDNDRILDLEFRASADGTVRGITVATTLGGPSVHVNLFNETVDVAVGPGNTATVPIFHAQDLLEQARERYMVGTHGLTLHE